MGRFDPEHRAARAAEHAAEAQRRQAAATRHLASAETRQAQALERIADALEGVIEIMSKPQRITTSVELSAADKQKIRDLASRPVMITTPAPQFAEPQPKDDLPSDEVEPLDDEDADESR